jgi:hypothetical protein
MKVRDFIKCKTISDECFISLIDIFDKKFVNLEFENLSVKKANALIRKDKLFFNAENFIALKSQYEKEHVYFIEKNFQTFILKHEIFVLDEFDYYEMLESGRINSSDKLQLIELIKAELINKSEDLANSIFSLLKKAKGKKVNFDILFAVLSKIKTSIEVIDLFNRHIHGLELNNITQILKELEYPYRKISFKRKRPKFENNKINFTLVKALNNIGYISSYSIKKGKIQVINKS